MNIKKSLLSVAIALGCLTAAAQTAEGVTEYDFVPHFYGQAQIGGQETLGEGSFGKLLSPNAQLAVGYQFNPLFGMRLGVNAWQSKGTMEFTPTQKGGAGWKYGSREYWKWNYAAPAVDVTFNLTNAFGGYNPERVCDVNIFAGVGCNIAWGNDEANEYNNAIKQAVGYNGLERIWDGTHARFMGRFGTNIDFRVSKKVAIGVELSANVLNDHYNSKKAPNADWYFNGLVGVKYTFGKSYNKRTVVTEPTIVERVVERIVEVPVEVIKEVPVNNCPEQVDTLSRDIFFKISNTTISDAEMTKVAEVAAFMKAHPNTTVTVTGYADAGTGTLAINLRLAKQRAQVVYDALVNKYGISPSRITKDSMTDHENQPFKENDLNRVAICIVK